ncbi:MAG: hypothetical protein ACLSVD_05485 [Eggerthellaceae bacterium]
MTPCGGARAGWRASSASSRGCALRPLRSRQAEADGEPGGRAAAPRLLFEGPTAQLDQGREELPPRAVRISRELGIAVVATHARGHGRLRHRRLRAGRRSRGSRPLERFSCLCHPEHRRSVDCRTPEHAKRTQGGVKYYARAESKDPERR